MGAPPCDFTSTADGGSAEGAGRQPGWQPEDARAAGEPGTRALGPPRPRPWSLSARLTVAMGGARAHRGGHQGPTPRGGRGRHHSETAGPQPPSSPETKGSAQKAFVLTRVWLRGGNSLTPQTSPGGVWCVFRPEGLLGPRSLPSHSPSRAPCLHQWNPARARHARLSALGPGSSLMAPATP